MISKGEITRMNYALEVMEYIRDELRERYGEDYPKEVLLAVFAEHMSDERGYRIAIQRKEVVANPDDSVYDTTLPKKVPDERGAEKQTRSDRLPPGTVAGEANKADNEGEKPAAKKPEGTPKSDRNPKRMIGKIWVLKKERKDADEVIASYLEMLGVKTIDDLDYNTAWACLQALNTLEKI